jgi:hypothetical protein
MAKLKYTGSEQSVTLKYTPEGGQEQTVPVQKDQEQELRDDALKALAQDPANQQYAGDLQVDGQPLQEWQKAQEGGGKDDSGAGETKDLKADAKAGQGTDAAATTGGAQTKQGDQTQAGGAQAKQGGQQIDPRTGAVKGAAKPGEGGAGRGH